MKLLSAFVSVFLLDRTFGAEDLKSKVWRKKILRRQNEHHITKREMPDGNDGPAMKRANFVNEITNYGANPSNMYPMYKCRGDCDQDSQCRNDLICFQRSSSVTSVPGCSGTPRSDYDYCVDPEDMGSSSINSIGANPSHTLGRCEGDCDDSGDYKCAGDLICHQRDTGDPASPGCSGTPFRDYDYCVRPEDVNGRTSLHTIAENPTQTLGRCEGDCDSSSNCAGDLICVQRDGTADDIPGCTGSGTNNYDYCSDCAQSRRKSLRLWKSRKMPQINKKVLPLRKALCIPHVGCSNENILNGHEMGAHAFMFECNINMNWAQWTADTIHIEYHKPNGDLFTSDPYSVTEDQCRLSHTEPLYASVFNNPYKGPLGFVKVTIYGNDAFHIDQAWTFKGSWDNEREFGDNNDNSWCISSDPNDAGCTQSRYFFHSDSCCGGSVHLAGTTVSSC